MLHLVRIWIHSAYSFPLALPLLLLLTLGESISSPRPSVVSSLVSLTPRPPAGRVRGVVERGGKGTQDPPLHRSATVVSLLVPLPTVGRRPPARYAVDGESEGTEDTGEAGRVVRREGTATP